MIVENIDRYCGEFGNHPAVLKHVIEEDGVIHGQDFDALDNDIKLRYKKIAGDQFLATAFLFVELGQNLASWLPICKTHTSLELTNIPKTLKNFMIWCWDILQ